ncbi:MAG: prepilin peptidase [Desulfobacteraceae bacterium]|nr:MAG: prepilin peptidase [Desulfobacteraceae bacterium]
MIPQQLAGIISILLGLCLGSFLNVCIYRLPLKKSLIKPPSHCPACGSPVRFYDNIPVISYLILGGRCRRCSQRISLQYPLVEILAACLSFFLFIRYGLSYQYLLFLVFFLALVTVSFIDLEHQIIPDGIVLPGMVLGLGVSHFFPQMSFLDSLLGAVAGAGGLYLVAYMYEVLTGKEGMGFGDLNLLAMIGAWVGWKALPMIVFFSSFTGAIAGSAYLLLARKGLRVRIPFGPFLSLGTMIYVFFGRELMRFYLSLLY